MEITVVTTGELIDRFVSEGRNDITSFNQLARRLAEADRSARPAETWRVYINRWRKGQQPEAAQASLLNEVFETEDFVGYDRAGEGRSEIAVLTTAINELRGMVEELLREQKPRRRTKP